MKQPLEFDMKSFVHALPGLWRSKRRGLALPWLILGFCTVALLISCGGGGGVGSGGTGATATASGTVTGFGSIIVDGVRFDDSKASKRAARTAAEDSATDRGVSAEIKLGQQLSFTFDGGVSDKGVADSISVVPTLIGPVTSYVAGDHITIFGITVGINTIAEKGPVTQVDDSVLPSKLSVGSRAEVHALLGPSGLVATRIEESTVSTDLLRGAVSTINGVARVASIGGVLVDLSAVPADQFSKLVGGQFAVVFGSFVDATSTSTATFVATRIRLFGADPAGKIDDYLSGYITGLDGQKQTFVLNGTTVDFSAAASSGTVSSSIGLANGLYVRVRGVPGFTAAGAPIFKASTIQLRRDENNSKGGDSELFGNILGLSSSAGTFTVRGVQVTVGSVIPSGKCSAVANLQNGLYVEVHGTTTASGVNATSIRCNDEPAPISSGTPVTVERTGKVTSIASKGATIGSFAVTTADAAATVINVTYNAVTLFPSPPITAGDKLALGVTLEIEGYFIVTGSSAMFVATKIKQD